MFRVEAEIIITDLLNKTQESELILESILSLGRSREKELADPVADGAVLHSLSGSRTTSESY